MEAWMKKPLIEAASALAMFAVIEFGLLYVQKLGLLSVPMTVILVSGIGIAFVFYAVFRYLGKFAGIALTTLMALWTLHYFGFI